MIMLGQKARDVVTGFTGIVTARVQYLTGCDQYALNPGLDKDGKIMDGHYFDENRLVIVDEVPLKLPRADAAEFEAARERRATAGGPQRDAPPVKVCYHAFSWADDLTVEGQEGPNVGADERWAESQRESHRLIEDSNQKEERG